MRYLERTVSGLRLPRNVYHVGQRIYINFAVFSFRGKSLGTN